jgi:hypothetical protein
MIEDQLAAVNSLIEELKETRTYLEQKKQFYRAAIAKRSPGEVMAIRDKLLSQALGDKEEFKQSRQRKIPRQDGITPGTPTTTAAD